MESTIESNGEVVLLKLKGPLNEQGSMLNIGSVKAPVVEIDLSGLTHINSIGVMAWISWLSCLDRKTRYFIRNCPKTLINQSNLIPGVLPEWITVRSVELPYYCEHCGHVSSIYLDIEAGKAALKKIVEHRPCAKCTKTSEIDVSLDTYFRFLQK